MEAPKCKICGERHWGHECGAIAPKTAKIIPKTKPLLTIKRENPIITGLKEVIEYTKKFDRNAYQRDYMRKRRAKDKYKLK